MFVYTSGSLEMMFKTGSFYEKSSAFVTSPCVSTIKQSNRMFPICRVTDLSNQGKTLKLCDKTHESLALLEDVSDAKSLISIGSVILIREYSLLKKNRAFEQFGLNESDYQLKSDIPVTNELDHVLVISGYQLIGIDIPAISPVKYSTPICNKQFQVVSLLRPCMMKTCVIFKACLTQKGKSKLNLKYFLNTYLELFNSFQEF